MPPKYVQVYPGLNDFSDALEAIPDAVIGDLEKLKDTEARFYSTTRNVPPLISEYFKTREKSKLKDLNKILDEFNESLESKVNTALFAARQVGKQVKRLETDFAIIKEQEIPQIVQYDLNDSAFVPIVPPEKQATARTQARREAREAREARRANQNIIESRSETPEIIPVSNRRRGRIPAAQRAAQIEQQLEQLESPPPEENTEEAIDQHNVELQNGNPTTNNNNISSTIEVSGESGVLERPPPPPSLPLALPVSQEAAGEDNTLSDRQDDTNDVDNNQIEENAQDQGSEADGEVEDNDADQEMDDNDESKQEIPPVVLPMLENEEAGVKRKRPAPKSSEPVYCYCQQGSYGEMVGCDGDHCEREWFHLDCIGLSALPTGQWYCEECRAQLEKGGVKEEQDGDNLDTNDTKDKITESEPKRIKTSETD